MEALKKRSAALALCILIVLASTAVSVRSDLTRQCRKITDGFSTGTASAAGYTQPSIESQLINLRDIATNVYSMLSESGDYSALRTAYREMTDVLEDRDGIDIEDAYDAYTVLASELDKALEVDAEVKSTYADLVHGAERVIEESNYNDTVREFLRDELTFPANVFAEILDVDTPELFK